mgnify:CR=1 FL=1
MLAELKESVWKANVDLAKSGLIILTFGNVSGFLRAGAERQVIWWDGGSEPLPEGRFDLAYVARNSTYRGTRELQVECLLEGHGL